MGPKKWPKQAAFLLFRLRNNKFVRNWQDKEIQLLGAQLVKTLNRIQAWGIIKEVTKLLIQASWPECPVSGDKSVHLPPDARSALFTLEIYFLLSGRQKGGSECLMLAVFK